MNPSHPRAVITLSVCSVLATGCYFSPEATGECQGTHLGKRVKWPISEDGARLERSSSDRYSNDKVQVRLEYETKDLEAEVKSFGVEILLVNGTMIDEPTTTKLVPQGDYGMGPQGESVVTEWSGRLWTAEGSNAGYFQPGRPVEGTVTFETVDDFRAEGHFVYLYVDGGKLTCTFYAPNHSS